MNNFPEHNLENRGGLQTFQYTPAYSVNSIPFYDGVELTQPVVLDSGATWYNGIALPRSFGFSETHEEKDAGELYKYQVNGSYPAQAKGILQLFDEMKSTPLVINVTDNNSQRRLIGQPDKPVKFVFKYESKDTPSGRPEYNFTFTWFSPKPAPFYNPPVI